MDTSFNIVLMVTAERGHIGMSNNVFIQGPILHYHSMLPVVPNTKSLLVSVQKLVCNH